MKYFICLIFLGLSTTVFSATTTAKAPLDVLTIIENESTINKREKRNVEENDLILRRYYKVKWLSKESPFIDQLEALA